MRNDVLGTDFYQILGIDYCASNKEIIDSFLIKIEQINDLSCKIQLYQAYQVLINPQKRAEYDRALLLGRLNTGPKKNDQSLIPVGPIPQLSIIAYPKVNNHHDATYDLDDAASNSIENMREFYRLPLQGDLIINEKTQAQLINISPKGLLIAAPELLDESKQVHIKSSIVTGIAKICFIQKNNQNFTTAGLKFIQAKFMPKLFIDVCI